MTGRRVSLVLGAAVFLLTPGVAVAQSPSPSVAVAQSPSPSVLPSVAPSEGASLRDGWKLVANGAPPFSVQLPPEWSQGAAVNGLAATSTAGESLTATPEALPAEPDFDAWVTRVEADLESAANANLLTTFREGGTGVIARIDEAAPASDAAGDVRTHFLFPLCSTGALTVDISGPAPVALENGGLDAWDQIAASVNPCAVDVAPVRALDAEVVAAGLRYLAIVGPANAASAKAYEPLASDTTLKVWRKQAGKIAKIVSGLVADLKAESWPTSVQPQMDALIAADESAAKLWAKTFAKAKNAKGITSHYDDLDAVNAGTSAAGRKLRFAFGLPTLPR